MKQKKREPGSGVSSSKSTIARVMRYRIPKVTNFSTIRNQQLETNINSPGELNIPTTNSSFTVLQKFPLLQLTPLQIGDPVAELDEAQPITVLKKHPQTL